MGHRAERNGRGRPRGDGALDLVAATLRGRQRFSGEAGLSHARITNQHGSSAAVDCAVSRVSWSARPTSGQTIDAFTPAPNTAVRSRSGPTKWAIGSGG